MHLRVVVSAPRSGSTLFMRVMATHPNIAVTSRTVLMGNSSSTRVRGRYSLEPFKPDYRIFSNPAESTGHPVWPKLRGKSFLVSKEEFGNDRFNGTKEQNECNFRLFPCNAAIAIVRPVFIFRDPIPMFDSWLRMGWNDVESFATCYTNLFGTYKWAESVVPETYFYVYENMVRSLMTQREIFTAVCAHWGIEPIFHLTFNEEFGSNFIYWSDHEESIYRWENPKGIFDTVRNTTEIISTVKGHGMITRSHKRQIQRKLGEVIEELNSIASRRNLP